MMRLVLSISLDPGLGQGLLVREHGGAWARPYVEFGAGKGSGDVVVLRAMRRPHEHCWWAYRKPNGCRCWWRLCCSAGQRFKFHKKYIDRPWPEAGGRFGRLRRWQACSGQRSRLGCQGDCGGCRALLGCGLQLTPVIRVLGAWGSWYR